MTKIENALLAILRKTETDSLNWSLISCGVDQGPQQVMFLNAHGLNMAADHTGFRDAVLHADYVLRDGVGLEMGMRMLGFQETVNLNGTDLIPKILATHKAARIAVWGSSDEALEKLGTRLVAEGYNHVVSLMHGFHDDDIYLKQYVQLEPDILVLCMGMPRQEVLSAKLVAAGACGVIICGGGWANFYSGHTTRAPLFLQRIKLEWLHRLACEPRRLGKRYTVDVLHFFSVIRGLQRQTRD